MASYRSSFTEALSGRTWGGASGRHSASANYIWRRLRRRVDCRSGGHENLLSCRGVRPPIRSSGELEDTGLWGGHRRLTTLTGSSTHCHALHCKANPWEGTMPG